MAKVIASALAYRTDGRNDWLRSMVVCGCACALLAAGPALPVAAL